MFVPKKRRQDLIFIFLKDTSSVLLTETEEDCLDKIEEETEAELVRETIDFKFKNFEDLSKKITIVFFKMKKIIWQFNKSNDLTRDLKEAQKNSEILGFIGDIPQSKSKSKSILNLIQDIITR